MALKVFSNVKQIISGQVPNASNLAQGELAFGKITEDQKYHLYANSGGAIVDLVQEGIKGAVTLDDVLTAGGSSKKQIFLEEAPGEGLTLSGQMIHLSNEISEYLDIKPGCIKLTQGESQVLAEISDEGFTDHSFKILSANPDSSRNLTAEEQVTVRNRANVYSKAEVDALIQALQTQFNEHLSNAKAHPDMDVSDAVASSASEAGFQQ